MSGREAVRAPARSTTSTVPHTVRGRGPGAVVLALLWLVGCAPLVRPATFVGARDQVTDASLMGPFDGQVLDATTGEPIADAMVVGVWAYDRGDGFIGPYGSETYSTTTDAAGRYRIAPPKLSVRASALRLVSFHVVVYKRGFLGYRSDALYEGGRRPDFVVRHNRVELRKWRETDSHADHLLFLAAPKALRRTTLWEQDLANLDLFRQLGGAGEAAASGQAPGPDGISSPGPMREPEWLDASGLLTIEEVRTRTSTPTPSTSRISTTSSARIFIMACTCGPGTAARPGTSRTGSGGRLRAVWTRSSARSRRR